MRRQPMEEVGDVVWDGTRRLRDAPIGEEGRDGPRANGREGESKRTRWNTSPLLGRRRGKAAEATAGGDAGGGVLTAMVVLCVEVAKSEYFNPKVQSGASFLRQVDFEKGQVRPNKKLTK